MRWKTNQKYAKYCEIYYTKTMGTYYVSCKKNTANKNSSFRKTKQNRIRLLWNCVVCGKKKSRFIKNQEIHNVVFNNFNNIWNN